MKRNFTLWIFLSINLYCYSQVGINTETPDSTVVLDVNGKTILRDVPDDITSTDVLVLDENKVVSKTKRPALIAFKGMHIPSCYYNSEGSSGTFNVNINDESYSVSWKIVSKQMGSTAQTIQDRYRNGGNSNGSVTTNYTAPSYPIIAQSLVVEYSFSPAMPLNPDGIMLTTYNASSYPDSFSLSYSILTQSGVTLRISRTDISSADENELCWFSDLNAFNMILFKN